MQNPRDFKKLFKRLLLSPVAGMSWEDKLAFVRAYMRELESRKDPMEESAELEPAIEIVPFEAGRRPMDEALGPGLGASEHAGLVSTAAKDAHTDDLCLLYQVKDLYAYVAPFQRSFEVRMSVEFLPHVEGDGEPCPVPGLSGIVLKPQVVSAAAYPFPAIEEASWNEFYKTVYAATLNPEGLLPRRKGSPEGRGYDWSEVAPSLRARTPDGADPFTFAHLFHQKLRITLALHTEGSKYMAEDTIEAEIYDTGRFGSLYARLCERLIPADTKLQADVLDIPDLHVGYHPWFPVLTIGTDKAMLYLHAIRQDLGEQRRNLPDPAWLLRVGLYLELLTCLGIFGAVRAEHPDLLSPAERQVFEKSPVFARIRERIDVAAWRRVWAMREIVPRSSDLLAAGPVSFANLLRKQKATLAFLHAHHEDLKHAIALAGPNVENAQETWHRVFRDAERAVLKNGLAAFPELGWLDQRTRDFAMWHQRGVFGSYALPESLTGAFGDQDGLFPSACRQYRQSMNEVARFARERGLMDHTGDECIPRTASLFEAYMRGDSSLVDALQRRDGYGGGLDAAEPLSLGPEPTHADIAALLRRVPVFKPLTDREVERLAQKTRPVVYGPHDRVVREGDRGSSLFILAAGTVEVLVRQQGGQDVAVATLERGAVFGEVALLTGCERTATVRTTCESTLYEISKQALAPIIESRPQLVVELGLLIAARQLDREGRMRQASPDGLAGRIRKFLLG
ncbi:cyclic nucleotide-binding domain-containing protein [Polyangium jinanense]|uniref:Cyclic nucleotide-binding domain-containing protein n=1 Tax=Polyangium jinanense TaxID=2829994 RepID=A0A9X3X6J5_9BACT|nr:cyclic nucleotide-binding domain-containing protein [Polyangium jinanense]MDC3955919.1 cyclic nucleotide-binding domain-containing protein [Polyangium jinanense]MDC3983278.1 cyclic nucleotide-binding domain-containing protein [Polyangium jinanense]MDC3985142.1 cyclic nucleotide-binding domain-containing protein [Polyangium jinanense]